jgi:hypothetical protein
LLIVFPFDVIPLTAFFSRFLMRERRIISFGTMKTNGVHAVLPQGKHFLNPAIVPAARKLAFAGQKSASTV